MSKMHRGYIFAKDLVVGDETAHGGAWLTVSNVAHDADAERPTVITFSNGEEYESGEEYQVRLKPQGTPEVSSEEPG